MCVTYCGSFPTAVRRVDREIEAGGARTAPRTSRPQTIQAVSRPLLAVQALLHQVPVHAGRRRLRAAGFPALMAREKAQRARRDGHPDRGSGARRAGRWWARSAAGPPAPCRQFGQRQPAGAQGGREGDRDLGGVSACRRSPKSASAAGSPSTSRFRRRAAPARWCCSRPATASTTFPKCRGRPCWCWRRTATRSWSRASSPAAACRTSTAATSTQAKRKMQHNVDRLLPLVARGPEDRRARADLRLHDQEGVAGLPGHCRGARGRGRDAGPDGIFGSAAPQKGSSTRTSLRASARSPTTRLVTCARRRSPSPARACSRKPPAPRCASSSAARRSTAPGA